MKIVQGSRKTLAKTVLEVTNVQGEAVIELVTTYKHGTNDGAITRLNRAEVFKLTNALLQILEHKA